MKKTLCLTLAFALGACLHGAPSAPNSGYDPTNPMSPDWDPTQYQVTTPCVDVDAGTPPAPVDPTKLVYTACAKEFAMCTFKGAAYVRFGLTGAYVYKEVTDGVQCSFQVLGDPAPGKTKTCSYALRGAAPAADAGSPSTDAGLPDAGSVVDAGTDAGTPVVDAGSPPAGAVKRPAASKGVGFFVVGSKVYDANGLEFRLRGTNKTHWDNTSSGLRFAGSNATRWIIDFNRAAAQNVALMQSVGTGGTTADKAVQIAGNWDGTCKSDRATLDRMVSTWVAQIPTWATVERHTILNIANEWGDSSSAWRDAYVATLPKLRAAGWHGLIMIDAGICGQDTLGSILKYGAEVLAADPEKNVIFSQHVYGYYFDAAKGGKSSWSDQRDIDDHFKALSATGLAVVIGEFGPGRKIGASPTDVTPTRVIETAEKYNLGWLSWSWDDNNLNGGMSDDNSFSHSYSGAYGAESDLTIYGKEVVPFWKKLAKPASIFAK